MGNFALDIWGKVARTGGSNEASDATAVGESTSTSSESGTKVLAQVRITPKPIVSIEVSVKQCD